MKPNEYSSPFSAPATPRLSPRFRNRSRLCANISITSGRVSKRLPDRTLPASAIATSQKSRCTSSPIALTLAPSVDDTDDSGELWANDTDGSALAAQPGQSQGAATEFSGSDAHRRKRPAHVAFSRRPLEPGARTVIRDPDGALGSILMPRIRFSHPGGRHVSGKLGVVLAPASQGRERCGSTIPRRAAPRGSPRRRPPRTTGSAACRATPAHQTCIARRAATATASPN